MLFKALAVATTAAGLAAAAGRPANESICSYYTTALLKNNTAANQETVLTLIVNTAVIGNYSATTVGGAVPGILAQGATFQGTPVNLLPYFTGGLASSNRGGSSGVSINFLDDGGATPLTKNLPSNGKTSAQYMLLTHLYQYFGALLGCDAVGYPAYAGQASMYEVHKFMDLSAAEVGYFISQVAASAASFGVATDDLMVVGTALTSLFDVRCAPPTVVIPAQGAQLQSICIDSSCPLAPNSTCSSYATTFKPAVVNSTTSSNGTSTSSSSSTGSGSKPSSTTTSPPIVSQGAAASVGMSFAAVVGGLFAAFL